METFLRNPGLHHIGKLIMWYLLHSNEETFDIIEEMCSKPSWTLILRFKKQAIKKWQINKQSYHQWFELLNANESSEFQEKFRKLIKHPIIVDNDQILRPPLHLATSIGDQEMVKCILKNLKAPFIKDGLGDSPFHLAVSKNQIEILKILMQHSTDINTKGSEDKTPLEIAIFLKNADSISLLLPQVGQSVVKNWATIPINMDKMYRIATAFLSQYQLIYDDDPDDPDWIDFEMEITNDLLDFIIKRESKSSGKEKGLDSTGLQCITNTECLGVLNVCKERGCICL